MGAFKRKKERNNLDKDIFVEWNGRTYIRPIGAFALGYKPMELFMEEDYKYWKNRLPFYNLDYSVYQEEDVILLVNNKLVEKFFEENKNFFFVDTYKEQIDLYFKFIKIKEYIKGQPIEDYPPAEEHKIGILLGFPPLDVVDFCRSYYEDINKPYYGFSYAGFEFKSYNIEHAVQHFKKLNYLILPVLDKAHIPSQIIEIE